ncbi:hypothetical protein [Frankia sp. R82]|uniref:hypothetical protein n=1 Tax=Frankia sp. R82 TaxID=2950553 RepID=UPI002042EEE5|nr:hypothetical protein [Frankia sp. R82]MCM3882873.1 hypothetical protein [Frankia sp. R82]
MADAALGLQLADVRELSLDKLRDSADEVLRSGVDQLLHNVDAFSAWSANDDSGGCRSRLD